MRRKDIPIATKDQIIKFNSEQLRTQSMMNKKTLRIKLYLATQKRLMIMKVYCKKMGSK